MGKIVVSENVSLDGVTQDPTGEEGFRHGGWFGRIGDKDREAWQRWRSTSAGAEPCCWAAERRVVRRAVAVRSGDWADRLNSLPKYVVSSTLEEPRWAQCDGPDGRRRG